MKYYCAHSKKDVGKREREREKKKREEKKEEKFLPIIFLCGSELHNNNNIREKERDFFYPV